MSTIAFTGTADADSFDVDVSGTTYVFRRDGSGRLVTDVYNEAHADILLAAGCYRFLDDLVAADGPAGERPVRGRKAAA